MLDFAFIIEATGNAQGQEEEPQDSNQASQTIMPVLPSAKTSVQLDTDCSAAPSSMTLMPTKPQPSPLTMPNPEEADSSAEPSSTTMMPNRVQPSPLAMPHDEKWIQQNRTERTNAFTQWSKFEENNKQLLTEKLVLENKVRQLEFKNSLSNKQVNKLKETNNQLRAQRLVLENNVRQLEFQNSMSSKHAEKVCRERDENEMSKSKMIELEKRNRSLENEKEFLSKRLDSAMQNQDHLYSKLTQVERWGLQQLENLVLRTRRGTCLHPPKESDSALARYKLLGAVMTGESLSDKMQRL